MFVDYKPVLADFSTGAPVLPTLEAGKLYQYLFAANGVFIHSKRPLLEAVAPVAAYSKSAQIKGLATIKPFLKLNFPKIPYAALLKMLELARGAKRDGNYVEILFHLLPVVETGTWRLVVPHQQQSGTNVIPIGNTGTGSSYDLALVEAHSHHTMSAFFSGTDDRDEQGFRLYVVLGDIIRRPTVSVRVGVFGHFLTVPAANLFDFPANNSGSQQILCGLDLLREKYLEDAALATARAANN
jgi:PRTRC genetic system protein A